MLNTIGQFDCTNKCMQVIQLYKKNIYLIIYNNITIITVIRQDIGLHNFNHKKMFHLTGTFYPGYYNALGTKRS